MNPNLLIVILNYRTPDLTTDCLKSLEGKQAEIPGGFRAIVVENASGDGSAAQLETAIVQNQWNWVMLMVLPENLGFAGGNNAALELLRSQYAEVPTSVPRLARVPPNSVCRISAKSISYL